jgi:predicted nucleic acid-binding protein
MIYMDSSALVAIYVPERFSETARRALGAEMQVPFTQLHQLEVPNAFELLAGRKAISPEQCRAILAQLQDDIDNQRLIRLTLDLESVFANACELSRNYTARFLTRSLDLLHVAAAKIAASTLFVSADDRQLAIAKASGLRVLDIKRKPRLRKSK